MLLYVALGLALALSWGATGFVLGYRTGRRRAAMAILGVLPRSRRLTLDHTVARSGEHRAGQTWEPPAWAEAEPGEAGR
ncbi:MAG: hypothetical protein JWP74_1673 [Marmoricola sp.]|nr:hypothetical protein [Marmoricola sp.]